MAENDVFGSTRVDDGSQEAVREDLNALRSDIAKLSEAVALLVREQTSAQAEKVREAVGTARETLTGAAESFRRAGVGIAEDAQARLETLSSELEESVKRTPVTSVLTALIAGVIFGIITRR
jgi:ElaB/YqjD/DUF883 family membrane-anchored ribosome-binding protein